MLRVAQAAIGTGNSIEPALGNSTEYLGIYIGQIQSSRNRPNTIRRTKIPYDGRGSNQYHNKQDCASQKKTDATTDETGVEQNKIG
jgi:hypothetical protein